MGLPPDEGRGLARVDECCGELACLVDAERGGEEVALRGREGLAFACAVLRSVRSGATMLGFRGRCSRRGVRGRGVDVGWSGVCGGEESSSRGARGEERRDEETGNGSMP